MGFLTNLVSGVMDNVIENKVAQNKKKLENDPELKKLENELAKSLSNFQDYIEQSTKMSQSDYEKIVGK